MALQRIDTAFGPNPIRLNGNLQPQANANVWLGNTSSYFAGVYSSQFIGTATFANLTYNLNGGSVLGTSGSFSSNLVAEATTVTSNVSTGSFVTRGGAGIAGIAIVGGNVVAAATTTSTSKTTGALVVVGGAGVNGNVYTDAVYTTTGVYWAANNTSFSSPPGGSTSQIQYNSSSAFAGSSNFTFTAATGNVVIGSTTTSANTVSGALVVKGGVGVAGTMYVGGNMFIAAEQYVDVGSSSRITRDVTSGGLSLQTSATTQVFVADTTGNTVINSTTTSTSTTTGALVVKGGIGASGTAIIGGNIVTASTTASTSTTTGALVVRGGAGFAGNITTAGWIIPSANVSQNLGTSTSWWNTFYGVSTQAQYADLAENYQADAAYEPGTVVEFGGEAEVTLAEDGTRRVAGVVSTNPAHLMNGGLTGENVVAIALQGRTPCRVRGTIHKGDMLVSAGAGFARPDNSPQLGAVIGKALENFDGVEGVIEVVVGRM